MATQFAIVRAQAQTAGGTQDVTSPDITDFSAAIGFIFGHLGDGGTPSTHARMCVGICTKDAVSGAVALAASTSSAGQSGKTSTTFNRTTACGSTGSPSRFLTVRDSSSNTLVAACNVVARASSGVANGLRLDWTTTPDAAYEMVFILFGGLANQTIKAPAASTAVGFETDAGFIISTSGSFAGGDGSVANDAQPNFGMFVNKGGLPQVCVATEWNTAVSPTDADAEARTNRPCGQVAAGVSSFSTLTAIGATTASFTVNSVSAFALFLEFADAAQFGVALETIPGATGIASFTGIGFRPSKVFGIATGVNASDTTTDGAPAAAEGFFAFGTSSAEAFAGAIRLDEGVTLGSPTPTTDASSLFKTKAVLLMDDTGAVATEATRANDVTGGFQLDFTSAGGGRMALFGIAGVPTTLPLPGRQRRRRRLRRVTRRRRVTIRTAAFTQVVVPRRPLKRQRRIAHRRVRAFIGGRVVGQPPLLRGFWKAIARMRMARLRRRRVVEIPLGIRAFGAASSERTKGRVFSPGLVRGRVTSAAAMPEPDQ